MTEALKFYPEASVRFGQAIELEGLVRLEHPYGKWEGDLTVGWDDPDTGQHQESIQRIAITIDSGFPFEKPQVTPLSELRAGARHRAPVGSGGALCLYSERAQGWLPECTGSDLLARIREWFVHYHRDDWTAADRSPDLHLYYDKSPRRHLAVTGDDWNPPAGPSGRFAVWEALQIILVSSPTVGLAMPNAQPPERLAGSLGLRTGARFVGIWFRLEGEPTPRETLAEVLSDIDIKARRAAGLAQCELRHLAAVRPRRNFRTFMALGYPGREGNEEWLFLDIILPAGSRRADRWQRRLREIRVRALEAAPAAAADLLRRTVHVQTHLAGKRLLIFGLGAIGSSIALLLAKAGLGAIVGVDNQQLRPSNCIRHAAGLRLSGCDKASALSIVIGQHAPGCDFTTHSESWNPTDLLSLAEQADLVIDATANEPFSLLLNEVCVQARANLLVVATYRRASVGRIRLIRPRESACLVCYLRHAEDRAYPVIPPGDEGEFVEGGCGDPTVEASALDVELVANVAARTAKDVLGGNSLQGTECLVVISPLTDGRTPLDTTGIHWTKRPPIRGCEACGRL